jgi:hypothetical protein
MADPNIPQPDQPTPWPSPAPQLPVVRPEDFGSPADMARGYLGSLAGTLTGIPLGVGDALHRYGNWVHGTSDDDPNAPQTIGIEDLLGLNEPHVKAFAKRMSDWSKKGGTVPSIAGTATGMIMGPWGKMMRAEQGELGVQKGIDALLKRFPALEKIPDIRGKLRGTAVMAQIVGSLPGSLSDRLTRVGKVAPISMALSFMPKEFENPVLRRLLGEGVGFGKDIEQVMEKTRAGERIDKMLEALPGDLTTAVGKATAHGVGRQAKKFAEEFPRMFHERLGHAGLDQLEESAIDQLNDWISEAVGEMPSFSAPAGPVPPPTDASLFDVLSWQPTQGPTT